MSNKVFFIGLILFLFRSTLLVAQNYINGELKSRVFEPENISTDAVEYSPTFSSSGSEIYFAKSNDKWGSGELKSSIYYSIRKDNKWSPPKLASFSGHHNDSDPHLTHDDETMFFISKRPSEINQISADIWMVEKNQKGEWGTPIRLNSSINSTANEYSPRTDKNGNLYFASDRPGGYGQGDLYMVRKENEKFTLPINLGNSINTDKGEWNLEISGDGELIIFEASERVQNLSSYGDLYISFNLNNKWTIPQNIKELNTTGSDLYPHLTNRENILYYTSSDSLKSTNTDIYFIDFKTIYDNYKQTSILPEK